MAKKAKSKSRAKRSSNPLKKNYRESWFFYIIGATAVLILMFFFKSGLFSMNNIASVQGAATGFDQYGYNDTARIFNGTGASWCEAKGMSADCMGDYSKDKLVMKWNEEWDRGNTENWGNPPYKAWTDNEWNGKKDGSGAVWHYKIVWDPGCKENGTPSQPGGYCIWGQFETIMDQGTDPNLGPGHLWFTKATPAGYGSYSKP